MNAKPILIPFEPFHVEHYSPDAIDRIGYDAEQFRALSVNLVGRAVSVIHGGRVIGIASWLVENDEALVSVLMTDKLRGMQIYLNREIIKGIKQLSESGVKRIRASSCFEKGKKWLEFLGFKANGERKQINGVWADVYVLEMNHVGA